jgi:hypothetical protein
MWVVEGVEDLLLAGRCFVLEWGQLDGGGLLFGGFGSGLVGSGGLGVLLGRGGLFRSEFGGLFGFGFLFG